MRKALLTATILGATIVSTGAQAADQWPYWYVGLNAGSTYQQDSDFTSTSGGGSTGSFSYDTGTQYGASLGYIFPQDSMFGVDAMSGRSRAELEYSSRGQDFDGASGDVEANIVTANYYYDFKSAGSGIMPYVGVGAGVAGVDVSPGNPSGANGEDTVGVYQAMIGLGYAFENAPRTEMTLGYKYLGTFSDPEVDNTAVGDTEFELDGHSVEVGAKFRF
jgi:outer membrane protein W